MRDQETTSARRRPDSRSARRRGGIRLAPRGEERADSIRIAGVEAAAIEPVGRDFGLCRFEQGEHVSRRQIAEEINRIDVLSRRLRGNRQRRGE